MINSFEGFGDKTERFVSVRHRGPYRRRPSQSSGGPPPCGGAETRQRDDVIARIHEVAHLIRYSLA